MKTIPKIRGYIANKKNKIVFLYRRSNKVTYLFFLDYQKGTETIQIGSRFYGRIYPNRCDISPDGTYFLYFAMGKSQQQYNKKLYCWTGICTPPNITAKMLFAHGDTWGGGGRFIDERTIFISPGMYPDFARTREYSFDRYRITFNETLPKGESWTSGKGWQLAATQINFRYGDEYPIPKYWTKTNGRMTLIKYLNYDTFLKSVNGYTMGSYDLHSYEIIDNKKEVRYSLNEESLNCLWADFDRNERLVVARGSKIFIYQNFPDLVNKKHHKVFDFETSLSSPGKR